MVSTEGNAHDQLAQLRALSHPLRMTLVQHIARRGSARAADLAAELGVPANSVSYHLRILARGGVIVADPDAGRDRRDKVWRLSERSYDFDDPSGDPDDYARAGTSALDWMREGWLRAVARPRDPEGASDRPFDATIHAATVRLAPAELEQLQDALRETFERFTALHRTSEGTDETDAPEGTRSYRLLAAAVADEIPAT